MYRIIGPVAPEAPDLEPAKLDKPLNVLYLNDIAAQHNHNRMVRLIDYGLRDDKGLAWEPESGVRLRLFHVGRVPGGQFDHGTGSGAAGTLDRPVVGQCQWTFAHWNRALAVRPQWRRAGVVSSATCLRGRIERAGVSPARPGV